VEIFVFFPAKELGPTSCLSPIDFCLSLFFSVLPLPSVSLEAKMSKHVNGTMPNEKKNKHHSCESKKKAGHLTEKQKIPAKIYFPGGECFITEII